jgi:hypothetical protein
MCNVEDAIKKIRNAKNPKELLEAIKPFLDVPEPTPAPGENTYLDNIRYQGRWAALRLRGNNPNLTRVPPTNELMEIYQWCIDNGAKSSSSKAGNDTQSQEKAVHGKPTGRGDKAGAKRDRITLQQFFNIYCDLSGKPDITSKREMLLREHREERIVLPLVGKKKDYRKGQTYLFWLDRLLDKWETYRDDLTTLPPLKKVATSNEKRQQAQLYF